MAWVLPVLAWLWDGWSIGRVCRCILGHGWRRCRAGRLRVVASLVVVCGSVAGLSSVIVSGSMPHSLRIRVARMSAVRQPLLHVLAMLLRPGIGLPQYAQSLAFIRYL